MTTLLFLLAISSPPTGAEVQGKASIDGRATVNAVVWLEGGVKSKPMSGALVDQRDRKFIPHVSVVTIGTKVVFPNSDSVYHNVFAHYRAKRFDLGMYPKGAKKDVTFDKPGVVSIFCNVHSDMSAYVIVVDSPYFAVSDKSGQFSIKGVQPGKYTLHAWHESGRTTEFAIDAKAGGGPLQVSLDRK